MAQPDDKRNMEQWAEWAGMSSRTLSRLFITDVHISFAQWRQQARLVQAIERLARGEAVARGRCTGLRHSKQLYCQVPAQFWGAARSVFFRQRV